jgi:hypothetical protein
MKKTIFALATATALAVGTLAAPTTADARCYGCAVGAGVAAGVIGGAIIGGAIANSAGAYPASGLRRLSRLRRSLSGCLPRRLLGSPASARSLRQFRRLEPSAIHLPLKIA